MFNRSPQTTQNNVAPITKGQTYIVSEGDQPPLLSPPYPTFVPSYLRDSKFLIASENPNNFFQNLKLSLEKLGITIKQTPWELLCSICYNHNVPKNYKLAYFLENPAGQRRSTSIQALGHSYRELEQGGNRNVGFQINLYFTGKQNEYLVLPTLINGNKDYLEWLWSLIVKHQLELHQQVINFHIQDLIAASSFLDSAENNERWAKTLYRSGGIMPPLVVAMAAGNTSQRLKQDQLPETIIPANLVDSSVKLNDDQIHYDKGITYYKYKQYPEAIAEFTKTIEVTNQDNYLYTAAMYERGLSYYAQKKYKEAVEDFDKVMQLDKLFMNNPYKCWVYGKAVWNLGNIRASVTILLRAIYLDLGYVFNASAYFTAVIKKNLDISHAFVGAGIISLRSNNYSQAIEHFEKANDLDANYKNDFVFRKYWSIALCKRGEIFREQGCIDKAIADFTSAIEKNPEDFDLFLYRSIAYLKKDPQKALENAEHALALVERSLAGSYPLSQAFEAQARCFYACGNAYYRLQDYLNSAVYFKKVAAYLHESNKYFCEYGPYFKAIELYDHYQTVHALYCKAIKQHNLRAKLAGFIFEKCEEALSDLDLQYAYAFFRSGITYYEQKKYENAINAFSKALELNNVEFEAFNASIVFMRSLAYLQQGNERIAEANLSWARAMSSKTADIFTEEFVKVKQSLTGLVSQPLSFPFFTKANEKSMNPIMSAETPQYVSIRSKSMDS